MLQHINYSELNVYVLSIAIFIFVKSFVRGHFSVSIFNLCVIIVSVWQIELKMCIEFDSLFSVFKVEMKQL